MADQKQFNGIVNFKNTVNCDGDLTVDGGHTMAGTGTHSGTNTFTGTTHLREVRGGYREVISLNNSGGSSSTRELAKTESGALVVISPSTAAAHTITVRVPDEATSAGVWYDIAILTDAADAGADVILDAHTNGAANFVGMITQGGAANHVAASQTVLEIGHGTITWDGTASLTFGNTAVRVTCDGTQWVISGNGTGVSGVTNPVLTN